MLRLIAGLAEATEGVITLDGRPIAGPSAERGMVFQSYTLFPWLTVRRNVEFGLELRGMPAAERAEIAARLIRQVGLDGFEHAYPEQLSGGMRQRTALARALANDPAILLMDEPFGALDSQTRALMQEMLLGIWEQSHKTVLFVTHDIDEALFLGDVVYVMTARPGRIKQEIVVDIPRPRGPEVLTAPRFVALKRQVLAPDPRGGDGGAAEPRPRLDIGKCLQACEGRAAFARPCQVSASRAAQVKDRDRRSRRATRVLDLRRPRCHRVGGGT